MLNLEKLSNANYDAVLRVFNLKNALIPNSHVCELTGIRRSIDYKNIVITLLKSQKEISEKMKKEIKAK